MKKSYLLGLPVYLRYFISVALVIISTYIKILFFKFIGPQTPFLLYLGIILIISRCLGKGPALFSLVLCIVTTNYFFMLPYYALHLNRSEAIQLLFFALEGYLIIKISNDLYAAVKKNLSDTIKFKAILEKSSDGIVVVNTDGKRTYCSPSVKNVIGYTDEEYLNFEPWKLGHPDEIDKIIEQYQQIIAEPGTSTVLLHRMKHKNGHWIWVESRVTNSLNDPNIKAMIANFNDVSQRVEMEQNRKDFIGIVSHELKSPLTSIKLYGQLLHKKIASFDDASCITFISKMVQQTNHMENMIVNLMDVSIINSGQVVLHITDFDFTLLIVEIVESLQQTTDKHIIHLNLAQCATLSADKDRISQVVINLVANAIKYSPEGGDIFVFTEVKDDRIVFSIRDKGIGIPAKDLDRIYDRLYRVNNSKGIKGLGLGLYICQQIIKLHRGCIGVESEEGKGSTFWFNLPLSIKVLE